MHLVAGWMDGWGSLVPASQYEELKARFTRAQAECDEAVRTCQLLARKARALEDEVARLTRRDR